MSRSNLHHKVMRNLLLSLSRCDKMCTPVLGYAGYRLACGGRLPPQTSPLDIFCLSGTATTLYMLKTKSPCQKHAAVLLYLSFAHDILAFIWKNFVLTFCRRKFDPARTSDLSQIFFFFFLSSHVFSSKVCWCVSTAAVISQIDSTKLKLK